MRACAIFFLAVVVCSTLGDPSADANAIIIRHPRQLDIFGNTRHLIEKLITDLRAAAHDAMRAVDDFEVGLLEQGKLMREKFLQDVQSLRDRVSNAIKSIVDKFTGSGEAVRECIDTHRTDASALFNETIGKTMDCADDRVTDINVQLQSLKELSDGALAFANDAMDEMQKCIDDNQNNILTAGSCLGSVAVSTEMKGAVFMAQSGLSVARLNLALATLPAALEVCAGTHLVAAGVGTARIVMEIGSCSATSIFATFTGNSIQNEP